MMNPYPDDAALGYEEDMYQPPLQTDASFYYPMVPHDLCIRECSYMEGGGVQRDGAWEEH